MMKRSIACFIILFTIYNSLLLLRPELTNYSPNQEQANIMNAQNYLYNNKKQHAVIVGSSLSTRLIIGDLPGHYNLAFGGLASLDGLNIIQHANVLPDSIFIETNEIARPENEDFKQQIFDPIPFYTKKYIIALRDSKKPLGFAELVVIVGIEKVFPKFFKPQTAYQQKTNIFARLQFILAAQAKEPDEEEIKTGQETKKTISAPILDVQSENYAKEPNMEVLHANVKAMKQYVDVLIAKGVHVYFFETPIRSDLSIAKKSIIQREVMLQYFPVNEYKYIPVPDNMYGDGGDGIHMNEPVAKLYTSYFKEQADAFIKNEL